MAQEFQQNFKVFVSRPYDKETEASKYWKLLLIKGLLPSARIVEERSGYKLTFYDASLEPGVDAVTNKVKNALDASDIFLCVLTDYRPAVLYETGYAQKLQLPTVYLLDRSLWEKPIPILIGVPDTLYYDGAIEQFDAIPVLLSQYLIRACEAADLRRRKQSEMYVGPVYSVTCYQDRHSLDFPDKIRQAKRRIYILTTNIDYFVNPSPQAGDPGDGDQFKLEFFEDALKRGVQITILTMDPDSNLVVERSKQIDPQYKEDVYKYREELRQAIVDFYKKFSQQIHRGSLVFKLYDTLPTQMIYIVDDAIYVPSMAGHMRSRNCIHVKFQENYPGVKETYRIHFDLVLRDATSIEQYSWIRNIIKDLDYDEKSGRKEPVSERALKQAAGQASA